MQPTHPATAHKFCQLIDTFIRNDLRGRVFPAWEIQVLLDVANCQREGRVSMRALSQYRLATKKGLEEFGGPPMLLSEYLASRRCRASRNGRQSKATVDYVAVRS
jgi:hypothetical protein